MSNTDEGMQVYRHDSARVATKPHPTLPDRWRVGIGFYPVVSSLAQLDVPPTQTIWWLRRGEALCGNEDFIDLSGGRGFKGAIRVDQKSRWLHGEMLPGRYTLGCLPAHHPQAVRITFWLAAPVGNVAPEFDDIVDLI